MNVISLFAGAGGMDLGFKKAGFALPWSNEYDKHIWATHLTNFPDTHLCQKSILDVTELEVPECDGMIGGPPCQSFSEGGAKRGVTDPRGQLFWEYIRLLQARQPQFFVAENVSGLLSERHAPDLKKFIEAFEASGYHVNIHLYKASDYGVAQDRERVIMVGYRHDLNKNFTPPEKLQYKKTLQDVIGNMAESTPCLTGKSNKNLGIANHEHMLGGFSSMFMSRNRVRSWHEASFTILAMARQTPLHPQAPKMIKVATDKFSFVPGQENLYRRLSVRECAKIQGFPDDFVFQYDKIENGYKMVGNAVPVELAYHIALKIKEDLI